MIVRSISLRSVYSSNIDRFWSKNSIRSSLIDFWFLMRRSIIINENIVEIDRYFTEIRISLPWISTLILSWCLHLLLGFSCLFHLRYWLINDRLVKIREPFLHFLILCCYNAWRKLQVLVNLFILSILFLKSLTLFHFWSRIICIWLSPWFLSIILLKLVLYRSNSCILVWIFIFWRIVFEGNMI